MLPMGGLQFLCFVVVHYLLVLDTKTVGHSRGLQSFLGDPPNIVA
jgi:hypothetical protein